MKKKLILVLLKNSFRSNAFNAFLNIKSTKDFNYLFLTGKYVKYLEPIFNIISNFFSDIIVVYNDYEFMKRTTSVRFFWNYPDYSLKNRFDKLYFICEPINNKTYKRFQLFPLNFVQKKLFIPEIIYFGEVDITDINSKIRSFFYKNFNNSLNGKLFPFNELLNDEELSIISDEKNEFVVFAQIQNLMRYEGVNFLYKNFKNFILVGTDWKKYGFEATDSNHSTKYRRKMYNGRICIDFGSKSGINCLFPRTIEIIENGGILLQSFHSDSNLIYGEELSELITFKNFQELKDKIDIFINNPHIAYKVLNLYQERFNTLYAKDLINTQFSQII